MRSFRAAAMGLGLAALLGAPQVAQARGLTLGAALLTGGNVGDMRGDSRSSSEDSAPARADALLGRVDSLTARSLALGLPLPSFLDDAPRGGTGPVPLLDETTSTTRGWVRLAGRPIELALPAESLPPRQDAAHATRLAVTELASGIPLLADAWVVTALVERECRTLVSDDTRVELCGETVERGLSPHDFAGDVVHGPYSRDDDSLGRAVAIDVKLVLAWHPLDRVHVEAGYAVAYLNGDYGALRDGSTSGHRSAFVRHGPCAGVSLDF